MSHSPPFWTGVYKHIENKHEHIQCLLGSPLGSILCLCTCFVSLFILPNFSNSHAPTLEHAKCKLHRDWPPTDVAPMCGHYRSNHHSLTAGKLTLPYFVSLRGHSRDCSWSLHNPLTCTVQPIKPTPCGWHQVLLPSPSGVWLSLLQL